MRASCFLPDIVPLSSLSQVNLHTDNVVDRVRSCLRGSPGPEVIKLLSMPNSTEHGIYPAHKC